MSIGGDMPGQGGAEAGSLDELRSRLDALQSSVERLGVDDQWAGGPAVAPATPPNPTSHAPPQAAYPEQQPYSHDYAPPPPPAPSPVDQPQTTAAPQPPAYAEPAFTAPPAATNGQADAPDAGLPTSVSIINVGPFLSLIDLRAFEESVAALEAVKDVHVRRYGLGRAEIEIALTGHSLLADELRRTGRPMRIDTSEAGELVIELAATSEPANASAAGSTSSPAESVQAQSAGAEG